MTVKVSLIITTYNWPSALRQVLDSVIHQKELPDEVIIADDGSTDETKALIERYQSGFPCPLKHIWHPDDGFLSSKIRNKAVVASSGDYLVFIDGDCIMRRSFIQNHKKLARKKHFVSGNRVLLTERFTNEVVQNNLPICDWKPFNFYREHINRRWALFHIPLGRLRKFKLHPWKGVKTCNIGFFKSDFLAVNGFDERYKGWGYEDSDLTVRLINRGLEKISGRFAVTVIHMWHKTSTGKVNRDNLERLGQTIKNNRDFAEEGINQYIC